MSELPSSSNCDMEKRISPVVDSSPLLINKNRESLKVKLLVRRSANQLVEQNILPPLKTSPAIHEQRKLLERAKTGDLLKAKIQQRPNREELERRHILEHHESHIDPSLADKRKMLEKAILVDQLNSKISHRPGPLELIEKNILHANEPIERIVKEGLLVGDDGNFLSFEDDSQSSESEQFQQQQARLIQANNASIITSSESSDITEIPELKPKLEPITQTAPIILVPANSITSSIPVTTIKIQNICGDTREVLNIPKPPPPPKLELITYHVKPVIQTQVKGLINAQNLFPIQIDTTTTAPKINPILPSSSILTSNSQTKIVQNVPTSFVQSSNNQKFSAPGKEKNRKKSKNKIIAKRAIKFHEYKGPSNKSGGSSSNLPSSITESGANKKMAESNYELIMQQQCLLEYLEGIYKNPNSIQMKQENDSIKHTSKPLKIDSFIDGKDEQSVKIQKPHVTIFPSKPSNQPSSIISSQQQQQQQDNNTKESSGINDLIKLSKMKVSELKAHLKRFNLPVSGPKPLLIERLKPYLPLKMAADDDDASVSSNVVSESNDVYGTTLNSVSSNDSEMDNMEAQFNQVSSSSKEDDIVAEQQRKIEELQIKLQQSQMELEKMKQFTTDATMTSVTLSSPIPSLIAIDVKAEQDAVDFTSNNATTHVESLVDANNDKILQHEIVEKVHNVDAIVVDNEIPKELNITDNMTPLPTSQDLNEIFEILIKNGEWDDIHDVKENVNYENGNNENVENDSKFIEVPESSCLKDYKCSPMLEDESLENMLGNVVPVVTLPIEDFTNNFSAQTSYPMDIDDASMMMSNSDFNSNFDSAIPSSFNFNDVKPCDNKIKWFEKEMKENSEQNVAVKLEHQHSIVPKSKNGLIGNFDQNLFDTLKNNNINNNINHLANNDVFLHDNNEVKYNKDEKYMSNNLNFPHNFDVFTGIPMDFENIILPSYNDLPTTDSLYQGNFNNINNSLYADDNIMNCEDSNNLLCNL